MNILTRTKNGDLYDEVAINKFPIIITDNEQDIDDWLNEFFESKEVIPIINKHVKNDVTFENSKIFFRFFNEETEEIHDRIIKISEKISIELWKI